MNGSNLAAGHPQRTEAGQLVLLERAGKKFAKVQELPIGRIPEGVVFTPDGKYLVVQHHPARELAIYQVVERRLKDTGQRIKTPGMPSSLRRADRRAKNCLGGGRLARRRLRTNLQRVGSASADAADHVGIEQFAASAEADPTARHPPSGCCLELGVSLVCDD